MRRIILVTVVVFVLALGFALGLASSAAQAVPPPFANPSLLRQDEALTLPLVAIQQQKLVTVTFSVDREDGTKGEFALPMLLDYDLTVTLTNAFTYEVPIIPAMTRLNIVDIESIAGLQYDITGIPYTAQIPEGVEIVWSPGKQYSGDFDIRGTVTNTDADRVLKDVNIAIAAYDASGRFLGIGSGGRLVIPVNETLVYGDTAEFLEYLEGVDFLDVAFYKILVTADFDAPPPTRGR